MVVGCNLVVVDSIVQVEDCCIEVEVGFGSIVGLEDSLMTFGWVLYYSYIITSLICSVI